ncbi:hypothetical protein TEA_013852 [Camellia sinensis var. sinensis]|uniref:Glutaredoxin domain-containing protein n=1 Tax=Camellia sinensis var. sinensis TaxID=542762 RepID=A0A4S4EFN7_CAMSN|nr:hypothetical protein TEA_013852 [Camellia sinensis var. sinensis]
MGSAFGSSSKSKEEKETALSKVKEIVTSSPVVVFSKTYCGYCNQVKKLLSQLGASYKVIELNVEKEIQQYPVIVVEGAYEQGNESNISCVIAPVIAESKEQAAVVDTDPDMALQANNLQPQFSTIDSDIFQWDGNVELHDETLVEKEDESLESTINNVGGNDGSVTQSALAEWTGQTTVPNVFIGGKHVGGCDSKADYSIVLMFRFLWFWKNTKRVNLFPFSLMLELSASKFLSAAKFGTRKKLMCIGLSCYPIQLIVMLCYEVKQIQNLEPAQLVHNCLDPSKINAMLRTAFGELFGNFFPRLAG